ncbi:hypothetical protein PLICRDRAFT_415673 [Plicaturopsis crispa FD-325 SS-3]|nr:hypothetical protein PLICRDRAFT_415673 [Plicaturopsis crispa FD-325 SS-3]
MALTVPIPKAVPGDVWALESPSGTVTPATAVGSKFVLDDAGYSSDDTLDEAARYERKMGDSELSYYLPSRASGVNDMYLHLGFRAPERMVRRARVRVVWSILRNRHPLLASTIEMHDYDDVRFVYTPAHSSEQALIDADDNLEYKSDGKDELIDSYLNGPRTLSNERLSYLIISKPPKAEESLPSPPATPDLSESQGEDSVSREYHFLMCAAHFLGDGMALHAFANDFFGLLGSDKTVMQLEAMMHLEWVERWGKLSSDEASKLPNAMEENFASSGGKFRRVVERVDFQRSQEKLIGGQTFPRQSHAERHTVVPTVPFDAERTKKMLKNCKAHGVSISAALFAICNIAWARISAKHDLPMLMYSALNLRPYFTAKPLHDSYWYLAVGYFNVILPTFLPTSTDVAQTFWHRARLAKEQSTRAAKSRMVASRSLEMARERGERARAWGKEDDEKERGTWVKPAPSPKPTGPARAPSSALLGLSLLGNLDGIYKHANFPSIEMHTLTTGSRQRHGGMLLFGYTFAGKLWVSLGYDENGFDKDTVDTFWANVLGSIDELLVN